MRIAKSAFIRPEDNILFAIPALALSVFVFAYSARFGQVSILAYYGLWLPLVLIDYRRVLGNYARYVWIFAFAIFAILSTFWSQAPSASLRAGIQYLSHVICALIAMRVLDVRGLTLGAVAGIILVLLYSLAFGYYEYDTLDGTFSFVGAFSSKNQLGFYASLGIYFSFAAVFILGERRLWLMVCGFAALLSAYCLLASQSATSVITTAAIIALTIGMRAVLMLSPRNRKGLFLAGAICAITLAVAAVYLGAIDVVLGAFGKDSTLTGRTYLWQQGIQAATQSPWVGVGYQAYWVQGFSEAERLWEEFFITGRGGFHFHNTYIEAVVETGIVGALLLSLILIVSIFGHLTRLLDNSNNSESYLLFGISVLLLVRSFVEIDILNPYHIGSFLLYFTAGKLTMPRSEHQVVPLYGYGQTDFALPASGEESRG